MRNHTNPTVNGSGSAAPAPTTTKTAEIAVILDRSDSMEAIANDGEENASRTFSQAHIADLIAEKRAQCWEFIFLAANQDAIAEAARLSIPAADARHFVTTPDGTRSSFRGMDELVRLKPGK